MRKKILPIHVDAPKQEEYNQYYMRISSLYRVGKWMLLLLFTLYLIVMLLAYRDSITYENFLYLTRNLQMPVLSEGSFSSVIYEEQENMAFASFKGELVVAGATDIMFYDGTGTLQQRDSTDCSHPVLLTGEKYLMVYDEGGTSYSLYTSIGRVYRSTVENIIQCAAVNDQGIHAITTRSQESKYCVMLYDASFKQIAQYYRDTYITGIALQSDGDQLAILSIVADGSTLKGEVTIGYVGSDTTKDIPLGDQIPLAASFLQNGTLTVVTDNSILFFDQNGEQKAVVPMSSTLLSFMDFSKAYVIVVCSENTLGTANRILIIDENGTMVGERTIAGKVLSVTAADGAVAAYAQGQRDVIAFSPAGEIVAEMSYEGNLHDLCVIDGRAVFCFSSGAQVPKTVN